MDGKTLQALVRLNNDFYRDNHASFSATRSRGWNGWNRVAAHLNIGTARLRMLDVACGNMRFERFVREAFPSSDVAFTCIDSCLELASGAMENTRFEQMDVIERLASSLPLAAGGYDAAVSFGFMHHVPTFELRASLLRELLNQVRPNGLIAVSFWKFAEDERLAGRARQTTAKGSALLGLQLEEGDYLLGWNGVTGAYRYCHSFTDAEISRLLETAEGRIAIVDRFDADGRNGALNGYAVIRRR